MVTYPTVKDEYQHEIEEMAEEIGNVMKKNLQDMSKSHELMEFLEIPIFSVGLVRVSDLYEIFMDKEKFRILVSKMNNKALW